ncbi:MULTISPECIES: acyltransferase family protein [Roseomonadaceae]|uniref:Acyltransferase n=1 Tax=Falsiroseomonas oleicola TaxID=2801474 RepID=A0ABS6H9F6_9PROT|nr:acyltransferase [Roseomonas oleicola]MBU8545341.1 acyltransferase [Roseomonas oleicola]
MPAQSSRLTELDALRGVAAVVLLLHHAWLLLPRAPGDALGAVDWLLEETPLRSLALGRPAVIFFFLLSGYVLVFGLMRRPTPWLAFAVQRALRLAPPVVLSVLVSWLLWQMTWTGPLPDELPDFAAATWANAPTGDAVLRQAMLLNTDPDNGLNPVLWSLVHEWRIGLLLPLSLAAAILLHWAAEQPAQHLAREPAGENRPIAVAKPAQPLIRGRAGQSGPQGCGPVP